MPMCTVGAPQKCVTRSASKSSQIRAGSTLRRHTWVAATAVTAHGKHQPLQWNIGSVQRYVESALQAAFQRDPEPHQIAAPVRDDRALGLARSSPRCS